MVMEVAPMNVFSSTVDFGDNSGRELLTYVVGSTE